MRVLFSSTFGTGHTLPMVPLARAFQDAGHQVRWATSADTCELVAGAGLDASPAGLAGPALRGRIAPLHRAAREVAPPERAAFMFPRMFGDLLTAPMAVDLLAVASEWQPDLLVHEQGELASPLVGAVLGTPASPIHSAGRARPISPRPPSRSHPCGPPRASRSAVRGLLHLALPRHLSGVGPSVAMDHIPVAQPLRPVGEADALSAPPDHLRDDGRPWST